jgi:hypothetical protein
MSLTEISSMGSVPHDCSQTTDIGLAVAGLLKKKHPICTAKFVARDLSRLGADCTIKTAENILAGKLSGKSITRLTLAYGLGFLIDAGAQITGQSLKTYIETQASRAREEHAQWEALLNKAENDPASDHRADTESMVGRMP